MKGLALNDNGKATIVLVDDEKGLTEIYESILTEYYHVICFNKPEDFLKYLEFHKECPFDVVITDLRMPRISGLQMISMAQALGFSFPSIVLSGHLSKDLVIEAMNVGVYRVLEKPAEVEQILKCIEGIVSEHRMYKIQMQIRDVASKLKETYGTFRLMFGDQLEENHRDPKVVYDENHKPAQSESIDQLLSDLETRLEDLLSIEQELQKKIADKKKVA